MATEPAERPPRERGQYSELARQRLIESRLTPNAISLTGFALCAVAAVLVWQEHFFWGHMQWIYTADPERNRISTFEKYVPDLMTDPFLRWLHRGQKWVLVYLLHAALIGAVGFGVGFLVADTQAEAVRLGIMVFLWGVVVRTVYVWHITWFVNSAAHRWGYRNYETDDRSRNNWWVALLTNGEGWHNNHHAAPRTCSQGHRWWEIDLTYTFVRVLEVLGLAKNVVPVKVAAYKQG